MKATKVINWETVTDREFQGYTEQLTSVGHDFLEGFGLLMGVIPRYPRDTRDMNAPFGYKQRVNAPIPFRLRIYL